MQYCAASAREINPSGTLAGFFFREDELLVVRVVRPGMGFISILVFVLSFLPHFVRNFLATDEFFLFSSASSLIFSNPSGIMELKNLLGQKIRE